MTRSFTFTLASCLLAVLSGPLHGGDGNRLTYLDAFLDPYYVGADFPGLTTPQWVGEEGVDAVVVLAIDDMRDTAKYEAYLRPILDRLKKIDGRAAVSIMSNRVDPADPQLKSWLEEGLSIEVHTYDHPCPCLKDADFAKAKKTYERCVDLMAEIPGNSPVAFRMPCCDSLNTPSPRFWTEIFNTATERGNFLSLDSSVLNIFTSADADLPREITLDQQGNERFLRYTPFQSFVNTIENYPYPYLIGRQSWQFPCVVPSDWEAQHVQKPFNPDTVRDLKLALDATVIKRGVFNLVFHPHGWIRNDQVVALIDHAVKRYGKRVKFLNFQETHQRLNAHLLAGNPIRSYTGADNGVRLLDLNDDGFLDVVIGNSSQRRTRIWNTDQNRWQAFDFPAEIVTGQHRATGVRFGLVGGKVIAFGMRNEKLAAWRFEKDRWSAASELLAGLEIDGETLATQRGGQDAGLRLRDLDLDGQTELLVANANQNQVFVWRADKNSWSPAGFRLPDQAAFVDANGKDAGLRLIDLNHDGAADVVLSNEQGSLVAVFVSMQSGWSDIRHAAGRGAGEALPLIVRGGANNGAWFHSEHLWVQNENTHRLPNLVDRRSFKELLGR